MAWVDILGEGGGGDGDGECCPSSGAAWPGLAGAAVCLWPSASVCLFEGMVPRPGRAARHRPARHHWKSKVTRDSLAQHTPAPAHRHQDHRRWFKGDTGPGGRGWSTHHSTQRPHLWCVGVLVCPRPVCSRCWWWRCVGARHSRPGDWRRPWMLQTLLAAGRGAEKLADWAGHTDDK